MEEFVQFGSESDGNKPNTLGLWTAWAYGASLKDILFPFSKKKYSLVIN